MVFVMGGSGSGLLSIEERRIFFPSSCIFVGLVVFVSSPIDLLAAEYMTPPDS